MFDCYHILKWISVWTTGHMAHISNNLIKYSNHIHDSHVFTNRCETPVNQSTPIIQNKGKHQRQKNNYKDLKNLFNWDVIPFV